MVNPGERTTTHVVREWRDILGRMSFRLFGHRVTFWKTFGVLLLTLGVVGVFAFGTEVYRNIQAIRNGEPNPLLKKRLDLSFSRAIANANVTPEDLAHLNLKTAPALGASNAKLTIVEFLDFDCAPSQAMFSVVRELMERYKDRVRFIVRNFPVEELHPRAMSASLAAACANDQGKFWPYHDKLFLNQTQHTDADLLRYAKEVGLDAGKFQDCYEGRVHADDIQTDVADALRAGVEGTPTFFFNGIKVEGSRDRETFEQLIKRFLTSLNV